MIRTQRKPRRQVKRSPISTRRANFAHSKKIQNRRWLVGFTCFSHRYGCDCTVDIPKYVKANFKRQYGFDYDDYCYYDLVEAPDAQKAAEGAWDQQGATEHPHSVWENVEVIGLAGTPKRW